MGLHCTNCERISDCGYICRTWQCENVSIPANRLFLIRKQCTIIMVSFVWFILSFWRDIRNIHGIQKTKKLMHVLRIQCWKCQTCYAQLLQLLLMLSTTKRKINKQAETYSMQQDIDLLTTIRKPQSIKIGIAQIHSKYSSDINRIGEMSRNYEMQQDDILFVFFRVCGLKMKKTNEQKNSRWSWRKSWMNERNVANYLLTISSWLHFSVFAFAS